MSKKSTKNLFANCLNLIFSFYIKKLNKLMHQNPVILVLRLTFTEIQMKKRYFSSPLHRDEWDFGLETETETRVVSVSVSSFETKASKSQSQSHLLRPKGQSLSLSIKIWDWFLKSQSQSQILRLESKSLGLSLKMQRMVSLIT